jgi:TonB-dependent starch-binding outer membrane protein SusC
LPPTRWEVGLPIGYFYGLQTDGVFQTQGEVDNSAQKESAQPGDLRYRDIDGNGMIDVNDRTLIGNPIPDMIMGISLNMSYKNIDFSVFADAQLGHDIIRNYERNLPLTNKSAYYIDRWHGEGTSNDFPRVSTGANDNDLFSDFWVEDGSYMRLKNIQLGYTLPKSVGGKIGMDRLRVYASVNNLYTFTKYKGYDPNISSGSPLGAGIDIGYYPQARTYMLGLSANF